VALIQRGVHPPSVMRLRVLSPAREAFGLQALIIGSKGFIRLLAIFKSLRGLPSGLFLLGRALFCGDRRFFSEFVFHADQPIRTRMVPPSPTGLWPSQCKCLKKRPGDGGLAGARSQPISSPTAPPTMPPLEKTRDHLPAAGVRTDRHFGGSLFFVRRRARQLANRRSFERGTSACCARSSRRCRTRLKADVGPLVHRAIGRLCHVVAAYASYGRSATDTVRTTG
jgi:hypothetical protein